MENSILNKFFNMKKGTRSANYDAEDQIPTLWKDDFEKLHNEIILRKSISEEVTNLHQVSQVQVVSVENFLEKTVWIFQKIESFRFSEVVESIVAQESLMLVYGLKIGINILPFIKSEKEAELFFQLHCALQNNISGLNSTLQNNHKFWHSYAFKIGLNSLALSLKAKEYGEKFFKVNDEYQISYKEQSRGQNPISFIAQYVSSDGVRLKPDYGNLPYVLVCDKIKEIIRKQK